MHSSDVRVSIAQKRDMTTLLRQKYVNNCNQWSPERDSNPHAPKGTTNFKSATSTIPSSGGNQPLVGLGNRSARLGMR